MTENIGEMPDTVASRSKPLSQIVMAPGDFFVAILIELDSYGLVLLRILDVGGSKLLYPFQLKAALSKKNIAIL